jgi:NADH-quinone oxidoreductase subunit J
MSPSTYVFWFLTFVAILSALNVVFTKNAVYSVLSLIVTFFAIAGHYFLMNAQFLGIVHIMVYAGAIMVLFLYVIMMLNLNETFETNKNTFFHIAAVVSAGLLMVTMVGAFAKTDIQMQAMVDNSQIGYLEELGKVLFNEFLLPFEIASILLLAAMVGAVYLSKKEIHT